MTHFFGPEARGLLPNLWRREPACLTKLRASGTAEILRHAIPGMTTDKVSSALSDAPVTAPLREPYTKCALPPLTAFRGFRPLATGRVQISAAGHCARTHLALMIGTSGAIRVGGSARRKQFAPPTGSAGLVAVSDRTKPLSFRRGVVQRRQRVGVVQKNVQTAYRQ